MTKFAKLFDKALSKIEDKFKIDIPKYREKIELELVKNSIYFDATKGLAVDVFPRDEAIIEFTNNKGEVVKSIIVIPSFNIKKDTKKVIFEIDKFLKTV